MYIPGPARTGRTNDVKLAEFLTTGRNFVISAFSSKCVIIYNPLGFVGILPEM